MSNKMWQIDQSILERVKISYDLRTDADLADFLGVKQNTIATWKRRGSVNLELILSKCHMNNANWLIYNEEPMWKSDLVAIEDKTDFSREIYAHEKWELENLNKQVILLRQRIDTLQNPPKVRDGNKFTLYPSAYTDSHYIKALEEQVEILNGKIKILNEKLSNKE